VGSAEKKARRVPVKVMKKNELLGVAKTARASTPNEIQTIWGQQLVEGRADIGSVKANSPKPEFTHSVGNFNGQKKSWSKRQRMADF